MFESVDPVAGCDRVLVEEGGDAALAGAVEVAGSGGDHVPLDGCAVRGVDVRPAWLVAG
ncbi:MAG TPA: hypothetical protein H9755_11380 [Candidatus Dietzia intestinigallinarum]|nr:hypothetical protein [Candidatus Dietzia intestinigallinarum]